MSTADLQLVTNHPTYTPSVPYGCSFLSFSGMCI